MRLTRNCKELFLVLQIIRKVFVSFFQILILQFNFFISNFFRLKLHFLRSKLENYRYVSVYILPDSRKPGVHKTISQSNFNKRNSLNSTAEMINEEGIDDSAQNIFRQVGDFSEQFLSIIGFPERNFSFIGNDITASIGHIAKCLALRRKIYDVHPEFQHKFFITSSHSANDNYLKYWEKDFPKFEISREVNSIVEREFWPFFERVSSVKTPHGVKPLFEAHDKYTRAREVLNLPPMLKLSDADVERGYEYLSRFRIHQNGNGKFVTIHVRNSFGFSGRKYVSTSEGRNADIKSYVEAIKFLISKGYFVVRIGEGEPINLGKSCFFLDYSQEKIQSKFLNTFFLAECEFMIGTNSGPICVPPTFGKRVLMTNAPSIGRTAYFPNSLMIPKLVTRDGKRIISLNEMHTTSAMWVESSFPKSQRENLTWRDNSSDEILDAVMEIERSPNLLSSAKSRDFERKIREMGSVATANIGEAFLNKWEDIFSN